MIVVPRPNCFSPLISFSSGFHGVWCSPLVVHCVRPTHIYLSALRAVQVTFSITLRRRPGLLVFHVCLDSLAHFCLILTCPRQPISGEVGSPNSNPAPMRGIMERQDSNRRSAKEFDSIGDPKLSTISLGRIGLRVIAWDFTMVPNLCLNSFCDI